MRAVVIGTGFESLASALRLRALGYDVDVLEPGSTPGGWARSVPVGGEVVELAPPNISSPWLFDELFCLFHERRPDQIEFTPSHLYRRNIYVDGSHLDIVSSIDEQEGEISRLSPQDARTYRAFLNRCEEVARREAIQRGSKGSISLTALLHATPRPHLLRTVSSLWRCTGRYFRDRRVRQAFSWQALSAGLNPLVASGHHLALHAAERAGGVWRVQGGLSALVNELVSLATRHGVRFHYNHTVAGFSLEGDEGITGVYSAHRGERVVTRSDLVVWGGEAGALSSFLPDNAFSPVERLGLRTNVPDLGMYVLFVTTKLSYPEVADHTVIFSERWEGLLTQIERGPRPPKDPILSVHRVAPAGATRSQGDGERFVVRVPIPHLGRYSGWKFDATGFKDGVISKLNDRILPGLRSHLEFAEAFDPRYARDVLNHPYGALYHSVPVVALGGGEGGFHHRMRTVPNLFLCTGTLPGVCGLEGALASGRAVVKLVEDCFPAPAPSERFTEGGVRSVG